MTTTQTRKRPRKTSTYGLVYINAGNDTNGNPRRGWIVGYGTEEPYFVDEGYLGSQALINAGISPHEGKYLPALIVTPGEYRHWLKIGR